MSKSIACLGVGLFLWTSLAFPAVILRQESGEAGAAAKAKATLYVESGKIRVESVTSDGKSTTIIFDGDKQVMWIIPGDGSYIEMTAASVEAMGRMAGQMQAAQMPPDAMKQLQDRLASLPPEQRAMAEQAMRGRMGAGATPGSGAAAPTITFKEKSSGQKFGSFTCTLYDELSNGDRTAEICAAPLDQVHFTAADVKTFEAMAKFMEPMRRMIPQGLAMPPVARLHGFPVHTQHYQGTRATLETTVLSVDHKSSLDANLFAVPAGLTKKDMMGGRGPR